MEGPRNRAQQLGTLPPEESRNERENMVISILDQQQEKGFRIMCRLCCKAGKQCSCTDSTANYESGGFYDQCKLMEGDKSRSGACTTFSMLPPSAWPPESGTPFLSRTSCWRWTPGEIPDS